MSKTMNSYVNMFFHICEFVPSNPKQHQLVIYFTSHSIMDIFHFYKQLYFNFPQHAPRWWYERTLCEYVLPICLIPIP